MKAYDHTADSSETRRILRDAGMNDKDIYRVLTISREVIGSGSIGVHKGEYENVKLIGSVSYIDTPQGRYEITQRDDHSGRSYISIVSVDVAGLRQRLHELLGADVQW